MKKIQTDLCIIGAGSGGLALAAGAVQMGLNVTLIEKGKMGGDCLNYGCVPSKALLAAAHSAHKHMHSDHFGISNHEPTVQAHLVYDHIRKVIAQIEPHDSVERFESLGVKVITAKGEFISPSMVQAGDYQITARNFIIATGSSPMLPPIEGLAETPYLTNETIFERNEFPDDLIILGGGPIGVEMAQAHRQLGVDVQLATMGKILFRDDSDLVDIVRQQLQNDGVHLFEDVMAQKVQQDETGKITVTLKDQKTDEIKYISGKNLLVAVGRQTNVKGLNLEVANVGYTAKGIDVGPNLRSVTNKKIYAMGDVAGGLQFTHVAGYHASILIKQILFKMPAKIDYSATPYVTYTDPELAQVGITEQYAKDNQLGYKLLSWSFAENDRAQAEHSTNGLLKAIVSPKGKILGCGIAGKNAGDLIQPWVLAMHSKLKIGKLATMIAPYPTLGEVNKRAAGSFYTKSLFSDRTKKMVQFLKRFSRS